MRGDYKSLSSALSRKKFGRQDLEMQSFHALVRRSRAIAWRSAWKISQRCHVLVGRYSSPIRRSSQSSERDTRKSRDVRGDWRPATKICCRMTNFVVVHTINYLQAND